MTEEILKGRLTKRKLIKWCNGQFAKLGIKDYEVVEIFTSRFRQHEYESGACRLLIKFKNITVKENSLCRYGTFLSFYRIRDYEDYLKNGYELYLKSKWPFHSINDFEIEVRKIQSSQPINPHQ